MYFGTTSKAIRRLGESDERLGQTHNTHAYELTHMYELSGLYY